MQVFFILGFILGLSTPLSSREVIDFYDLAPDADEIDACTSDAADDCITGYTSLLQQRLQLKSRRGDRSKEGKANGKKTVPDSEDDKVEEPGGKVENLKAVEDRFSHDDDYLWIGVGVVILFFVFICCCVLPAMKHNEDNPRRGGVLTWLVNDPDSQEAPEPRIHDAFEEDSYCLAMALLVRDLRSLAKGTSKPGLKLTRICYSFGLILLTVGLQVVTILCVKWYVCPLQVADVREAYDKYENVMYDGHIYLNRNGKARGIPGYFDAARFDKLEDDDKESICNIPFSQMQWLFVLLLVWTITCAASLRKCFETFVALIVMSENKDSMASCLTHWEEAIPDAGVPSPTNERVKSSVSQVSFAAEDQNHHIPVKVITGLTPSVKVLLTLLVFLPEFLATSYLLWLGCRWLSATNDFGNLVSNAVGLEFLLQLKCMIYYAMGSERNKRDLAHTGLQPCWSRESAGIGVYFNTVIWLIISIVWVWMYLYHFQRVLPDYHDDVHQVCGTYLANVLKASGGTESG